MNRPDSGTSLWVRALATVKEFLQVDLALTRFAFRHASPEAQRVLCAPVAALLAILDRFLPR